MRSIGLPVTTIARKSKSESLSLSPRQRLFRLASAGRTDLRHPRQVVASKHPCDVCQPVHPCTVVRAVRMHVKCIRKDTRAHPWTIIRTFLTEGKECVSDPRSA